MNPQSRNPHDQPELDESREIENVDGAGMGMTIGDYDRNRRPEARGLRTLCHAPFGVVDFGPQGQIRTCNHYQRDLGNLNRGSWLDAFHGHEWNELRRNMLEYRIAEPDCRQCSRLIRAGKPAYAFAQQHFDAHPARTATPQYPSVMIFRLSNACNLKCVMCSGIYSHRIRKERENLPPLATPVYDERFFAEIEEALPHVDYIEFYGGEPFLIQEQIRILDLIEKTGSGARIFVNTNGTVMPPKIKGYIERLNFSTIAVSIDAVAKDVHARVRVGIDHDACMENLRWLLDLRQRKDMAVCLNTTETRFNWYHLPEIFRFAAANKIHLHVNTCLHPADCTIYDLPTEELAYVGDFFERARETLTEQLKIRGNAGSYSHLQSMVQDELRARRERGKVPNTPPRGRAPIYDGLMAVPEIGDGLFATPDTVLKEIERVAQFEARAYEQRMASTWLSSSVLADAPDAWAPLKRRLETIAARAGDRRQ